MEYGTITIRLPVELRESLKGAARANAHSMNAEVIDRLQARTQPAAIGRQNLAQILSVGETLKVGEHLELLSHIQAAEEARLKGIIGGIFSLPESDAVTHCLISIRNEQLALVEDIKLRVEYLKKRQKGEKA